MGEKNVISSEAESQIGVKNEVIVTPYACCPFIYGTSLIRVYIHLV